MTAENTPIGLIFQPPSDGSGVHPMQAAYSMGDRRVEIRDAEPVLPAPGTVQLDVAYTGICGTARIAGVKIGCPVSFEDRSG